MDGSDYPTDDCPILKSIATLTRETNHPDTFWRKDGTPFPVMWSCSPISKLGRPIGAVLEFRDVTEEKALEKDKLKAILMTKHQEITIKEANASKQRMTQFLDYIAHELRNPLVSLKPCCMDSMYETALNVTDLCTSQNSNSTVLPPISNF